MTTDRLHTGLGVSVFGLVTVLLIADGRRDLRAVLARRLFAE